METNCNQCLDKDVEIEELEYLLAKVARYADSLSCKDKLISTKNIAEELYGILYK